ncbi:Coenzyme F420 hydrogenase/dehydrogenase, beta subunit C-terminal domain [Arundinibacter roseus]|nr:Coenzyme F420 hydrogenase/dehydrogenase, beta subunit C-terminal domain [Arundinibacter roseus]
MNKLNNAKGIGKFLLNSRYQMKRCNINTMESRNLNIEDTVIKGGYCIGCGVCAVIKDSPYNIKLDDHSKFVADRNNVFTNEIEEKLNKICPFSEESKNEDQIGEVLYKNSKSLYSDKLGHYIKSYAGYVLSDGYRERGSSGGAGSWILNELYDKGLIDGVLHVKNRIPTKEDKRLFHYSISKSKKEILSGAKSKYYPIELSEVLRLVKEHPGKYALIGLPCFIKAVRLLMEEEEIYKKRIVFCIGLVCGHLKSTRFAEMLAWQNGIHPKNLLSVDFRTKLKGYGANQYGITVSGMINGVKITKVTQPVAKLFGTNWGHGFFKYKACDFCDDVMAETADITIGDAWLPQYIHESEGTNILIIRNQIINNVVNLARKNLKVKFEEITEEEVIKSQNSGISHRREGLAYRLMKQDECGKWRPIKRVKAKNILTLNVEKIQNLRQILADESHLQFSKALLDNNFEVFVKGMVPYLNEYNKRYKTSIFKRIENKLTFIKNRLISKIRNYKFFKLK